MDLTRQGSGSEQPACRHPGTTGNVVFVDGHGEPVTFDEFRLDENDTFGIDSY